MKKRNLLFIILMLASVGLVAQMPLNWYVDELNPGEDITLMPDEENFTQGAKSCHAQMNSADVPYLISDDFPVNVGAAYTFSIDYLDNDPDGVLKFYCDFRDDQGGDIFGEDPILIEDDSPDWRTIEWTGTVPADAAVGYILIKFYTQDPELFTGIADQWLDNAIFVEDGQSNAVANGGFEDWTLQTPESPQADRLIEVYPNPATGFVRVNNSVRADRLIITDLTGKTVINQVIRGNQKIDLTGITPGMYITTFMSENKFLKNQKLIIR